MCLCIKEPRDVVVVVLRDVAERGLRCLEVSPHDGRLVPEVVLAPK